MGSIIVMEPDDIAAYIGGGPRRSFENLTTICTSTDRVRSGGVFAGSNPLEYSVPLLLMQLGICSVIFLLCSKLLRPLGLPLIVSQLVGGIVLGSSILGHFDGLKQNLFPLRGFILLDIVSSLGSMFYFFLSAVQTDFSVAKEIDRRAFCIGFCSVVLPLVLTSICSISSMNIVGLDPQIAKALPAVGSSESMISSTMVTCLLLELHMINSEFGRIALSSSLVSGLCSVCFMVIGIMLNPRIGKYKAFSIVSTLVSVTAIIVFSARLIIQRMIKDNPVGQPLKEGYVITLVLGVLVTGVCCQAIGVQTYVGPLILGFAIPPGPPIGSALVERFDLITSRVLMPIFFVKIGWVINIFIIKLKDFLVLSSIVFVAALGKFLGTFMFSIYFKLPVRDAVLLGLIMNTQGIIELSLFKTLRKDKLLNNESFSVLCICLVILMSVITPMIRYLYDPSRRYVVYRGKTVMHSRPESDFRLIVCIHDQEDVPNAINLLESLNPTRQSHLVVYMLHLVELSSANPQLISHNLAKTSSSRSYLSEHIVNAFKYFGESNRDIVEVYPFTAISPSATMHENVCTLALDKSTSLVLVPFHKRFHSSGVMSLCKSKMRMVNNHILNKAPCSVALIVDRGLFKVSSSITIDLYTFHIVVVFVGGPDDREAMFIGERMVGHPNISLTVIRLLAKENVSNDDDEERRLDNEAVSDFRESMASNCKVMYIEEVAMDSTGTVSILRSMGNNFDIVMVGRQHCPSSPLIQGLVLWDEDTELGAIGEVLASSDFMGNALILVVQQHTREINEDQENHQQIV